MTRFQKIAVCLLGLGLAGGEAGAETYDCVIEPSLVVELASPTGGLLQFVDVARGDLVTQGQLLARLVSDIEETTVELMREQALGSENDIAAQRARLKLAHSRADRIRSLVERKIAPQADLDEAEATAEVAIRDLSMSEMRKRIAAMELRRAEAVLKQRSIVSPIDGVVIDRLLYAGEFADQDTPVVRIAQLDPLHVEAYLPVTAYAGMEVGTTATIIPASTPDDSYPGVITVIDKVFDAASNTFAIRGAISNPDLIIPAGNRCSIRLDALNSQ